VQRSRYGLHFLVQQIDVSVGFAGGHVDLSSQKSAV
jgi:hypothetical protein